MDTVVVLGSGLTAAAAVAALREEGHTGAITLVGDEPLLPYERPQLSKDWLTGSAEFAVVHEAPWFGEQDIRVVTGTAATALDREARTVMLDTGEQLAYDGLLLATGARPRRLDVPGAEHTRHLRTFHDAQRLRAAFGEDRRLVVVGGGWIALEVAAAARQAGTDVTLLARSAPLAASLGEELAAHVVGLHTAHGTDVRVGVELTGVDTNGEHVVEVSTTEGYIDADAVLVAIGVEPNEELAASAGLAVADGVVTDPALRTEDPHVWAAGDVARATHTRFGPLRTQHWDDAMRQGRLAARSMLGIEGSFDWLPYVFTDQHEFSMEYVGRHHPDDRVVIRGDLEEDAFIAYWLGGHDGRTVTAGMNVGIWDVNDTLREMVGTTVDPGALTDLR